MKLSKILAAFAMMTLSTSAISQGFPLRMDDPVCRPVAQDRYDRCMRERWAGSVGYQEQHERCQRAFEDAYLDCIGFW